MTDLPSGKTSLLAVVAIPVRNERDRIAACIAALASQTGMAPGSFGIVLFLNNCTDGTETVVATLAASIACPIRVLSEDHPDATAGWARRSAMEAASDWLQDAGADNGIILTTDADSRVSAAWIRDNIACIKAGADAVAGRIILEPSDAEALPTALLARGRLEERYETLLTEIGARLDPEPWNTWPCHWTTSGATLAVRRLLYTSVGGMPALRIGEDRAFVSLLRSNGALIRHAPEIVVTTSGRLDGRAPHGVADTIKHRCANPDALCDERLEPVYRAVMRVAWRRRLRNLHGMGRLTETWRWSSKLGLSSEQAARCVTHSAFSLAFSCIETSSPRLAFRPLHPRALPAQIALARIVVWAIRLKNRIRPAGHRSDSVPRGADEGPPRTPSNGR